MKLSTNVLVYLCWILKLDTQQAWIFKFSIGFIWMLNFPTRQDNPRPWTCLNAKEPPALKGLGTFPDMLHCHQLHYQSRESADTITPTISKMYRILISGNQWKRHYMLDYPCRSLLNTLGYSRTGFFSPLSYGIGNSLLSMWWWSYKICVRTGRMR